MCPEGVVIQYVSRWWCRVCWWDVSMWRFLSFLQCDWLTSATRHQHSTHTYLALVRPRSLALEYTVCIRTVVIIASHAHGRSIMHMHIWGYMYVWRDDMMTTRGPTNYSSFEFSNLLLENSEDVKRRVSLESKLTTGSVFYMAARRLIESRLLADFAHSFLVSTHWRWKL